MKMLSLSRIAIVAFVLGSASLATTRAQTSSAPPPDPAPTDGSAPGPLNAQQRAQWKRDHDQVLATNPALKAEEEDMVKKRKEMKAEGASMSRADKKAISEEGHEHLRKLKAAEIALDPSLAAVIAQEDAWRRSKHAARAEHSDADADTVTPAVTPAAAPAPAPPPASAPASTSPAPTSSAPSGPMQ